MKKNILIALAVVILIFLGYVASRPNHFEYSKNGLIKAPPEKIFPYLNNFKLGAEWNPYEKKDPQLKKAYSGPDSGPGSKMEFDGNKDVGSGQLEILKETANSTVDLQLEMTKPFHGVNLIHYSLTPEADGTRFTWAMSGENIFLTKLIGVFIDCEKMVTADFVVGIQNLKTLIESKN